MPAAAQGSFRIAGVSIGTGGTSDIVGKGLVVHANR
jgi:hypothetical protein